MPEKVEEGKPKRKCQNTCKESGLTLKMASWHTFSRRLNEKGYGFYQVRKKGLVTERDKILRMKYSRQVEALHEPK
jgi:extradiol dioxygenase family protein